MLAILLFTGGIVLGQVEAAAPDDLDLRVRRLVRQLDSPALAEREAAEEKLLELGPDVLERLPQAPGRMSAEVAQRVERVRQKLQRAMAESAGQASQVTLHGEMPLAEALAAIQEQTGNKIVFRHPFGEDEAGPKVKVDFDNVPFWEALDRVLDQAKLGVYPFGEEMGIQIVPRPCRQVPRAELAAYRGPFRFEPVSIRAEKDLRCPDNESLHLILEVSWEPRLEPVTIQQRMADIEAVDEYGESLPVQSPEAVSEMAVNPDSTSLQIEILLKLPPRAVKRIERLKGTLKTLLPSKVETFRFEDLEQAENVERRVAGVTVQLERVRKNRATWETLVRVRFDEAGDALQSHLNWIDDNEVYLEDAQGKLVSPGMFTTTGRTESEVGMAYYFPVEGPLTDYTLVYKTPGLILLKEIEYELEGIELP